MQKSNSDKSQALNNKENNQPKAISFKQQSSVFSTVLNQQLFLPGMTKSYNFNINHALDYTCHRQTGDEKLYSFCGHCNSCQIVTYLNNLKQWFDRAGHLTLKKFLIGLVVRINNIKIYKYLNDLLKPISESKDFVYARNKYLPSCDQDQMKPSNNRCLDNDYVNKQINFIWVWYLNSNNFIKQNFMLSILTKCEQALVYHIIVQIKSILDSTKANLNDIVKTNDGPDFDEYKLNSSDGELNYNSDTEIICEAYDEEDDDDDPLVKADEEVKSILDQPRSKQSIKNAKYIDFIRLVI